MNGIWRSPAVINRWQEWTTCRLHPLPRDIAARLAISLLASTLIACLIEFATGVELQQFEDWKKKDFAGFAFAMIFIAPPLENLIVVLLVAVLTRLTSPLCAVFATSIVMATIHAPAGIAIAVVVSPAFVVYAATYLAYRPMGWWKAYSMSVLIHAADNSIIAAWNYFEDMFGLT